MVIDVIANAADVLLYLFVLQFKLSVRKLGKLIACEAIEVLVLLKSVLKLINT